MNSPAATADATPVNESSNATDRSARAPSPAQAARNGSGCGLPVPTRSMVTTAAKWATSPSWPSTSSTQSESEFEAMAIGMPTSGRCGDQVGDARTHHQSGQELVVMATLGGASGAPIDHGVGLGLQLGHPAGRPRLPDHVRPPIDRVVEPVVGPDHPDGLVLDGLRVGDGPVEVEHDGLDRTRLVAHGRAHRSAATVASTRPSNECGSAVAAAIPCARRGRGRHRSDGHHDGRQRGRAGRDARRRPRRSRT